MHLWAPCDNTPTVSWVEKMASKANTPTAGRLLRGLAFMLHCHHAGRLTTVHVPGTEHVMADIASHPTKAQKLFHSPTALSNSAFCSAFDAAFLLPDDQQWILAASPPWVRFNIFETLHGKQLALPLWTGPNRPNIGRRGLRTAPCMVHHWIQEPRCLIPTSYLRLLSPCGKASMDAELKSRFSLSKKALRHVAQKLVLDGHPDPRKASPAQQSLDLPISRLLKSFGDRGPPAEPKLAIPIYTITAISEQYRWNPHLDAVADLITIAFFYLLRVGEYTSPATFCAKQTIPLRMCDVRLWQSKGIVLQHSSGLANLLMADNATICIAHTKNGSKGVVVHHEAIGEPICPVAALTQRITTISLGPLMGTLNTVYHGLTAISKVTDHDIGTAVRWGAMYDGLLLQGYTLNRVSSHSLRAGGAMALKLSGALDSTIMRVGRWTLLTYLTYIHTQIGALMAGLAWKMSTAFTFQIVG
jgi:hypothetical protein